MKRPGLRATATARASARQAVVLKLGGELLERPEDIERIARAIAALSPGSPGPLARNQKLAAPGLQLVVVHGGGKEIDAALAVAGIAKRQVDGLRVTDAATLEVVVAVLAGAINTRLVAAVRRAGAKPVGLTGADATVVTVKRLAPVKTVTGDIVDLGLVGTPVENGRPQLLSDLLQRGYVPVIACVGATRDGRLMNVNADTLASHLARAIGARRLVIAGGTSGVLDEQGQTIARMTGRDAARLIKAGTANKGMVAKLQACRAALAGGVRDVVIANGRESRLDAVALDTAPATGCTQVVR